MTPAKREGNDPSDAVKSIIKKYLGRKTKGRQLLAAFEEDPENNGEVLVNYLRDQLPQDKYDALLTEIGEAVGGRVSQSQINNIITGGKIDQLINIGRLDHLTIEKKISPFRDVRQLVVFLSVFLLVAAGTYAAFRYSRQPRQMNGDFNIAVAQFGEITDAGIKPTALSRDINASLLTFLESEFKNSGFGLNIDVSNENMPLITEDADAEELADQIGATIVIYGNVYVQGGEAKLTPRFYVSRDLGASELTGEAELAKPIFFDRTTLHDQEKVKQDLKGRSAILVNFTYSLIYLAEKNFEEALLFSQEAIAAAEASTDSFAGKENLYLVAAQLEAYQQNYEIANRELDEAFAINPNYARAHIARGNIYYLQATESPPYDETLLDKALREYEIAYAAQDQPLGANIPFKAHRSMGNIYFLRAQNAGDDLALFENAIEHYTFVTEHYERSSPPALREATAQTYFDLGIAYERIGDSQTAIAAFENALKTTSDPELKSIIENQLQVTRTSLDPP